ncbi:MAG: tRNA uridine-5-carboxymethylaminomethyl(34) synthesis GTPase MnmE, partial [Desulfamplus sp.]|nr:tRNA uridine-5-carboxymethylaminomethyl(34) synthesis GTPase MnmE [Desulfamplus sp.]
GANDKQKCLDNSMNDYLSKPFEPQKLFAILNNKFYDRTPNEPGEFTKRAFLNGRIDLTQAEAVADIINARTADSLKIAVSQGLGNLKNIITNAREELVVLLTGIEAAVDFPEEAGDLVPTSHAIKVIKNIKSICNDAVKQYEDAHFLRDGLKICICGPPNVGKSSLMNRILDKERSIVTELPGTTRDLIEESLNINGIPFVISDTAGMHDTDDLVEKIGIEKAKKNILESDMILFMEDVLLFMEDIVLMNKSLQIKTLIPDEKKVIVVLNKIDKITEAERVSLPSEFSDISGGFSGIPVVAISAAHDLGIDLLRRKIVQMASANLNLTSSVVPNLRHKTALKKTSECLELALKNLSDYFLGEETLAIDIRSSINFLGEITGDTAELDILEHIFSKFCIGK